MKHYNLRHYQISHRYKWALAICFCLMLGMITVTGKQAHALSATGPDPNDFSSGSYGFIVTSALSPNVVIPTTHVNIYFKNNTGTKKVTITDADMCTDPRTTGGNYRDLWVDGTGRGNTPRNGQRVSQYFVQAGGYTSPSIYGVFNSANNCKTSSKTLSFPGSKLQYQADINMYVASFQAQGLVTWPIVNQNIFFIRISDAGSIVGYDSGLREDSFGISRRYPSSGYTNYNLKFGTECSVKTPQTASGYVYDDDNGDPVVQPNPMWNELRSYKPDGTFAGNVPLTWSGEKRLVKLSNNRYEVFSGSEHTAKMSFTARPGYTYDWYWNGVYYVNILQFRLPFDSIYAVEKCPANVAPPQCGEMGTFPTDVDPDTSFKVQTGVDYSNGDSTAVLSGGSKMKITVAGPGVSYSASRSLSPQGGDVLVATTASIGPSHASGTYTVTWSVVGPVGAGPRPPCHDTFNITYMPYFSVKGGDVSAGASMGVGGRNECATSQDQFGGIASWNQENSAYSGAGTQYAAFAMGLLQDYATAQGTASKVPTGLGFANVNVGGDIVEAGNGNDKYGGELGSEPCVPDYFSRHPLNPTYTTDHTFDNTRDLAPTGVTQTTYITGNLTIDNPISVPRGSHNIIYVQGNVQINQDITFVDSYPGGIVDIPSFTIIAQGDIMVNPNVNEIDGWYIAQPDTASDTNGVFYTCAKDFTATPLSRQLYNNCNNSQLTVDGSVVARQIWLGRTFGTLYANSQAERFFFDPELWLANPLGGNSAGTTYDSITSLPPAL